MSQSPKRGLSAGFAFVLNNPPVVFLLMILLVLMGLRHAPFDWQLKIPRDPVPVDAIPDIGENQQIVFTRWQGRSPRDMEDQVTYPLTIALQGIPGVRTIRSNSYFGFSSIYVIFEDSIDFYWSRARILEKLNSLPQGLLPQEAKPALGPDATALGQIFWYTLEGRDEEGKPTGGWDLHEIRTVQDFTVRYSLMSVHGVAEVASVGGYAVEYQVDVDPDAMRAQGITLNQVFDAVRKSNKDVGARNLEINHVEYFIRGLGYIRAIEDLEYAVVTSRNNVPVYIKDIARVTQGPAQRRGLLDKGGTGAVGGVVTARHGANPQAVIEGVKQRIEEISGGLPERVLPDGRVSRLTVVPFYDRSGLIQETLATLKHALTHEVLITLIVILVMLFNPRAALLPAIVLPPAILITFSTMRISGVDANIVALSGIAVAIGTMVDMGIVMSENIVRHIRQGGVTALQAIHKAATEVGGAIMTAAATTIISFLPVFTLEAAEGKLFRPLAFTKTFALVAALLVTLMMIPPLAHFLFRKRQWLSRIPPAPLWLRHTLTGIVTLLLLILLAETWSPLGPARGGGQNFFFTALIIGAILGFFLLVRLAYPYVLRFALDHKLLFLVLPTVTVLMGGFIWQGWPKDWMSGTSVGKSMHRMFPGLGQEFMPPLDEGSFLYMPTTSAHAAINEAADVLRKQDMAFAAIPEVSQVVGKLGRADTPLDPAPISMIETVINVTPRWIQDEKGKAILFAYRAGGTDYMRAPNGEPLPAPDGQPYFVRGRYLRDDGGALIPDQNGKPFSLWRLPLDPNNNPNRDPWPGIQSMDDVWDQVVARGKIPGTTSAPRLQPIAARLVMLQSGMRAPMGVKIKGPDLATLEAFGLQVEAALKQVPTVNADAVIADRIVGKPYLEFHIDRKAAARYGVRLEEVQDIIEAAVGGKTLTTTVEGRERYPVRVRYPRELRDTLDSLKKILVPTPGGADIPLSQISELKYVKGPQVIKSEDGFPVSYVLFDKRAGFAEIDVVEAARQQLIQWEADGKLKRPEGVTYTFAGNYENQQRSAQRLAFIIPVALALIFVMLYLQFRSMLVAALIFCGVAVACAGGFIMLWLYGREGFMDVALFGVELRNWFGVGPVNLSTAVWVGFLALFGIATDDGVLIATYLRQRFDEGQPTSVEEMREAALAAGKRRVRAALMTSATTIIALVPVITAQGRGADLMAPMAIPLFGGMMVVTLSIFVVPVLYCAAVEWGLLHREKEAL